jgi:hypothetical protein
MMRRTKQSYIHTQLRIVMNVAIVLGLCITLFVPVTHAQFTPEISYQGKLNDSLGASVADGSYEMHFTLYDAAVAGTIIWDEVVTVTVTNGLFTHMLGSSSTLSSVDFDQPLYLGVAVGTDTEMSPRKPLGAVPAAFMTIRS